MKKEEERNVEFLRRPFQCQHIWFYYRKWYRERCISTNASESSLTCLTFLFCFFQLLDISIVIIRLFFSSPFVRDAMYFSGSHTPKFTTHRYFFICKFEDIFFQWNTYPLAIWNLDSLFDWGLFWTFGQI